MEKEQIYLLIIDDLKHKLADAEHRASDYKAQAQLLSQQLSELEFIKTVIDGTPELKQQFDEALKKLKEEVDGIRNLHEVLP